MDEAMEQLDRARTPVSVVHLGPSKTGTTWLFEALRGHPELRLARRNFVHYFDIHYHRGPDWLEAQFAGTPPGGLRVDITQSYLRDPQVPARVKAHNPEARLILSVRDPVERAFSHYWHEKKKLRFNFRFEECLENHDLYAAWIESGFYATHLERWQGHFDPAVFLVQDFAELGTDPAAFLHKTLDFIGVSTAHSPDALGRKINTAGRPRHPGPLLLEYLRRGDFRGALGDPGVRWRPLRQERLADVDPAVLAKLRRIFAPEIDGLETLTGRAFPALRPRSW